MNNRTYVIIDTDDVASVDFDAVFDTEGLLRYSLDGTKTFVKFEGDTPDFLEGKTLYTHGEIRAVLATPEWDDDDSTLPQ